MTHETVDRLLTEYRASLARCKYLEGLIPVLKEEIEDMHRLFMEESFSIRGATLDALPHGNEIADPTQKIGILLASGYQPEYLKEKELELKEVQKEYKRKVPNVIFVEAWLKGLSSRERFIIENHVIDGLTWNELIAEYERSFGEVRTKRCLQNMKRKALEKIYSYAV